MSHSILTTTTTTTTTIPTTITNSEDNLVTATTTATTSSRGEETVAHEAEKQPRSPTMMMMATTTTAAAVANASEAREASTTTEHQVNVAEEGGECHATTLPCSHQNQPPKHGIPSNSMESDTATWETLDQPPTGDEPSDDGWQSESRRTLEESLALLQEEEDDNNNDNNNNDNCLESTGGKTDEIASTDTNLLAAPSELLTEQCEIHPATDDACQEGGSSDSAALEQQPHDALHKSGEAFSRTTTRASPPSSPQGPGNDGKTNHNLLHMTSTAATQSASSSQPAEPANVTLWFENKGTSTDPIHSLESPSIWRSEAETLTPSAYQEALSILAATPQGDAADDTEDSQLCQILKSLDDADNDLGVTIAGTGESTVANSDEHMRSNVDFVNAEKPLPLGGSGEQVRALDWDDAQDNLMSFLGPLDDADSTDFFNSIISPTIHGAADFALNTDSDDVTTVPAQAQHVSLEADQRNDLSSTVGEPSSPVNLTSHSLNEDPGVIWNETSDSTVVERHGTCKDEAAQSATPQGVGVAEEACLEVVNKKSGASNRISSLNRFRAAARSAASAVVHATKPSLANVAAEIKHSCNPGNITLMHSKQTIKSVNDESCCSTAQNVEASGSLVEAPTASAMHDSDLPACPRDACLVMGPNLTNCGDPTITDEPSTELKTSQLLSVRQAESSKSPIVQGMTEVVSDSVSAVVPNDELHLLLEPNAVVACSDDHADRVSDPKTPLLEQPSTPINSPHAPSTIEAMGRSTGPSSVANILPTAAEPVTTSKSSWYRFAAAAASTARSAAKAAAPVLVDARSVAAGLAVKYSGSTEENQLPLPLSLSSDSLGMDEMESVGERKKLILVEESEPSPENFAESAVTELATNSHSTKPVAVDVGNIVDSPQSSQNIKPSSSARHKRKSDQSLSSVSSTISPASTAKGMVSSGMITPTVTDDAFSIGNSTRPGPESSRTDSFDEKPPLFPKKARSHAKKLVDFLSKKLGSVDPFDDRAAGGPLWKKHSEYRSFDPKCSVFTEESDKSSISPPGSPPVPDAGSLKDENDSLSLAESKASLYPYADTVPPELALWDMVSNADVSNGACLQSGQRPDFVVMPRSFMQTEYKDEDDSQTGWGHSSHASLATESGPFSASRTRRTSLSDLSVSSKHRRTHARKMTGSLRSFNKHSNSFSNSFSGTRRRSSAFLDYPSSSLFQHVVSEHEVSEHGVSEDVREIFRYDSENRSSGRNLERLDETPRVLKRSVSSPELQKFDFESAPVSLARRLEACVKEEKTPDSPHQLRLCSSSPFPKCGHPSKETPDDSAVLSPNFFMLGRSEEEFATVSCPAGDDEMLDEALVQFSSVDSLTFTFQRQGCASTDDLAVLSWEQLTACWKHSEMSESLVWRPSSYHFPDVADVTDNRTECGSSDQSKSHVHQNPHFPLELHSPRPAELQREMRKLDGLPSSPQEAAISYLAFFTESLGARVPRLQGPLRHSIDLKSGADVVDQLLQSAESLMKHFSLIVEDTTAFAAQSVRRANDGCTMLTWHMVGIKERKSIIQKAERKYGGDVKQVKDILRGQIVFADEGAMICGLSRLSKTSEQSDIEFQGTEVSCFSICRIKNLFARERLFGPLVRSTLPTAYRHILVTLRFHSGLLAGESIVRRKALKFDLFSHL